MLNTYQLNWQSINNHKSQGATLDYVVILSSRDIFIPGQAYTALSRIKPLMVCLLKILINL